MTWTPNPHYAGCPCLLKSAGFSTSNVKAVWKSWKITLVLESPWTYIRWSWKVLECWYFCLFFFSKVKRF